MAAGAPALSLRPVVDQDRAFLLRVYASTRAEELAPVPWTDAEKADFVAAQFAAQDAAYRANYRWPAFDVICVDGVEAGRLYLDRHPDDIRIMDIALLPEYRGRGVGGRLLRSVQAEGRATGRRVSIHIERFNPARRLYERLGFAVVDEGDVYLRMEWLPALNASGEDGLVGDAADRRVGAEGDEECGAWEEP